MNDFEYKIRKHKISGIDKITKVLKLKEKIAIEEKGKIVN
jgi:hypothetical protein